MPGDSDQTMKDADQYARKNTPMGYLGTTIDHASKINLFAATTVCLVAIASAFYLGQKVEAWSISMAHQTESISANTRRLSSLEATITRAVDNAAANETSIVRLEHDLKRLDEKVVGDTPRGWHREKMERWCYETERLNRELGWQCDNPQKEQYD